MKRFTFDWGQDGGMVEVDERVLERGLSVEFSENFYTFRKQEEVVAHLLHNIINNELSLSRMDGFADMPDHWANVLDRPFAPQASNIHEMP